MGDYDPWWRCKTCKNYEVEKSNENWIVCRDMEMEVVMAGTSEDCKHYEEDQSLAEED